LTIRRDLLLRSFDKIIFIAVPGRAADFLNREILFPLLSQHQLLFYFVCARRYGRKQNAQKRGERNCTEADDEFEKRRI